MARSRTPAVLAGALAAGLLALAGHAALSDDSAGTAAPAPTSSVQAAGASRSTSGSATTTPSGSASGSTPASGSSAKGETAQRAHLSGQQLARRLSAEIGSGDSFSVAAFDLDTGTTARAGATSGMVEASLVKLDILETALYTEQQGGWSLDESNATAMMDQSDNVAADAIFQSIGGNSALSAYNSRLGLTATELEPNGVWGLSTTSAADQLTLMKALVSESSPLNAASRAHALQLMGAVESDQRWGVSAAADRGADTNLKNGWLDIDSDGGLWAVNSAGLTVSGGDHVLLVVLSQHQPDFQTGVDRVSSAASLLADALG